MEDPNLIFTLKAISGYAQEVFQRSDNQRFYIPPSHHEVVAAASRESTPATNVGDDNNAEGQGDDKRGFCHQLRFTFNQKPRCVERGFVFGSNPKTCDVLLGRPKDGISGSHFRITFNDKHQLVLIDQSTHGTAVSYGGQAWDEKRKNPPDRTQNRIRNASNDFMWILFPEIENKRVIIGHKIDELPNAPTIEFSVEVVDPEACDDQYRMLSDAYLDEMRTAIPFGLNMDSHLTTAGQTALHSPTQRPKQRPIWINRDCIGSGQFGTVCRVVNVSTGVEYAAKTLLRKGKDIRERWDREVAILRNMSHDHIVRFEDHDADRTFPRLIMEYLHHGNLADQHEISRITEWETATLLCQGLDALDYLHSRRIVHRDLKPENILVHCREPANFCIKIADFGLAKDDSFLRTCCGTRLYAAPEIWKGRPYTAKVDIWSLGVIAFQFVYGLPEVQGQFDPRSWYQELARLIDDWDSDRLLDFLSSSMLKEDPLERLSASKCSEGAAKVREGIALAQDLDLEPQTPTEAMSSSAIMGALQAAGYGGSQHVAAEKAEKQINLTNLWLLKSGWQPGGDRGYSEMAKATTQIRDPPGDADWRPNEDEWSRQEAEIGTGNTSDERDLKRQRIEQPSHTLSPNQQKPLKQFQDEVLMEDSSSDSIQMVLEGKVVCMRKLDCWLNATQILALTGKTTREQDRILGTLRQHTTVQILSTQYPQHSWVPYQDGRFLCELLQLTDTLQPLLEYGLKQGVNCDDRANYFLETRFLEVKARKATVFIRRRDLRINATHLLREANCDKRDIAKVRKREGIQYDIVQGGAAASQGTYVDAPTGLRLCREYQLNSLESILQRTLEDHGYWRGQAQADWPQIPP